MKLVYFSLPTAVMGIIVVLLAIGTYLWGNAYFSLYLSGRVSAVLSSFKGQSLTNKLSLTNSNDLPLR